MTGNEHSIIITRVFNAPLELFYKVWTSPEHIEQWWGPEGMTTKVLEYEFKVGGKTKYVMISPDGKEYPVLGVFKEIVENEKIVTTDAFGDEFEAYQQQAQDMGYKLPKIDSLSALFEEVEGKTKLTLIIKHPTYEDKELHQNMKVSEGWNSSFNCLDTYINQITS